MTRPMTIRNTANNRTMLETIKTSVVDVLRQTEAPAGLIEQIECARNYDALQFDLRSAELDDTVRARIADVTRRITRDSLLQPMLPDAKGGAY